MPLNDERPTSTSSGEDQGSDVESSSERCDSMTSTSDLDCSRESFTSDCSSKHCTPSCEFAPSPLFLVQWSQKPPDHLWLFSFFFLIFVSMFVFFSQKSHTSQFDFCTVFYLESHSRNNRHCQHAASTVKHTYLFIHKLCSIWFPQRVHPKP